MYHGILIFIVCLCLFVLFLLFPRTGKRQELLKLYRGTCFAHRGYHSIENGIPENSMPAFRQALSHGYGIELDVHLTKDGRLVVFHDDTLNRVCKKSGTIENLTVPELKTCRLQDTEEQIPLFEDVLSLVNGQVPLLIELKIPGRSTAICQHVHKALSCYHGNYMIQSVNTMGLFWYRRHAPEVLRGQLSSRLTKDPLKELWFLRFLAENLLLNFLGRPDFISYKLKSLPKFTVSFLRKFFGTPTAVWTLRTPEALLEGKRCYDMQIFEKHGENY